MKLLKNKISIIVVIIIVIIGIYTYQHKTVVKKKLNILNILKENFDDPLKGGSNYTSDFQRIQMSKEPRYMYNWTGVKTNESYDLRGEPGNIIKDNVGPFSVTHIDQNLLNGRVADI